MGYEGTNIDATVQEIYKVFTNEKGLYQKAVANVRGRFASGDFSETWINMKFIMVAKFCITTYGVQYRDQEWIENTIADEEIVSALAIKFKEDIMTELEE